MGRVSEAFKARGSQPGVDVLKSTVLLVITKQAHVNLPWFPASGKYTWEANERGKGASDTYTGCQSNHMNANLCKFFLLSLAKL